MECLAHDPALTGAPWPSPRAAQFLKAFGRFGDTLGVGFVGGDFSVDFHGAGSVGELLVVNAGGAHAGVGGGLGVPLKTALEVGGRAAVVFVRLAVVNVAELVGGLIDLVALGILGEQFL